MYVCVCAQGGRHSRSPSVVSLTVETALGSFDFLNTSDWEEEEDERGERRNRNGRSVLTNGLKHTQYLRRKHFTLLLRCIIYPKIIQETAISCW